MKTLKIRWRDQVVNMSLPESGVLSAMVSVLYRKDKEPADDELRLHLGGLDSTDGMHPHWGDYLPHITHRRQPLLPLRKKP